MSYEDSGEYFRTYKDLLHAFAELDLHSGKGSSMSTPDLTERIARKNAELCQILDGVDVIEMRVVTLEASQQIVAHTDAGAGTVRLHIPLQTQVGCWSYYDGSWEHLREGRIYAMDPRREHGAVNWSPLPRYHLMIDVR